MESRLWTCLTTEFLGHVKNRYHYETKDMEMLRSVARDMAGCMRWQESTYLMFDEKRGGTTATVIMTLGVGVDLLQERYQSMGRMLESYMVESIGAELLMQGYKELEQCIKAQTGYYVAAYHFFGEDAAYPLCRMREVLACAGQTKVTCNEGFCLTPRKSVVFCVDLSEKEEENCGEICDVCSRRAECSYCRGAVEGSV